jgi:hypothetical protein
MSLKVFFVGILSGATLIGSYLHGKLLLEIPTIVASVAIAVLGWYLKQAYENYVNEIKALRGAETALIENLAKNSHNKDFFKEWRSALKSNTLYSVVFRDYVQIKDIEHIRDSNLYNILVKLSISFEALGLDVKNFFSSYAEGSKEMLFSEHLEEWYGMNKNMNTQTKKLEPSFEDAEDDTLKAIAELRAYFERIQISSFKIIKILSKNIFPLENRIKVKQVVQELKRELESSKET